MRVTRKNEPNNKSNTNTEIPNEETLRAMEESERLTENKSAERFTSVEDLMKALENAPEESEGEI